MLPGALAFPPLLQLNPVMSASTSAGLSSLESYYLGAPAIANPLGTGLTLSDVSSADETGDSHADDSSSQPKTAAEKELAEAQVLSYSRTLCNCQLLLKILPYMVIFCVIWLYFL